LEDENTQLRLEKFEVVVEKAVLLKMFDKAFEELLKSHKKEVQRVEEAGQGYVHTFCAELSKKD
jgi:hypothetical protein